MVIAWYGLASCGIFVARYAKQQFFGLKLFGKDVWFTIHQVSMITTWMFTLVGVLVLITEYKFAPLNVTSLESNNHAFIGAFATGFMFIQVSIGLLFRARSYSVI